jgi:propanediol utilization protein
LGVEAQIKQSGDLYGTPGVLLSSGFGEVKIKRGVIIAKRHIHMNESDAKFMNVSDNQEVSVLFGGDDRKLTMSGVVVRVSKSSVLEMHLDTDEANASGLTGKNNYGSIVL